MVSLEVFQEQFGRLKEAERGKDQLIEVRCRHNFSPLSGFMLIACSLDRILLAGLRSWNWFLLRRRCISNVSKRPQNCTNRSTMTLRRSLRGWTMTSYASPPYTSMGIGYWLLEKGSNNFVSVLIDGDSVPVRKYLSIFWPVPSTSFQLYNCSLTHAHSSSITLLNRLNKGVWKQLTIWEAKWASMSQRILTCQVMSKSESAYTPTQRVWHRYIVTTEFWRT